MPAVIGFGELKGKSMIRITIESIDDEFQDSSGNRSITIRESSDGESVGSVLADAIQSHQNDLMGCPFRTIATAILSMEPDPDETRLLWESLRYAALQYDKKFVDLLKPTSPKT